MGFVSKIIGGIFGGGERESTQPSSLLAETEEEEGTAREDARARLRKATGHTGTIKTGPGGLTATAAPVGTKSLIGE